MTNHIVLFEPLMPANTGNIARTCAGTNTELHLIKPLGFSTDDKYMKRAGLDYWDKVKITYHENLPEFLESMDENDELYVVSKFAERTYADVDYTDESKNHYFLFGRTPYYGYDSPWVEQRDGDALIYKGVAQRVSEVFIVNMLTWAGLFGCVLFFLIYYKIGIDTLARTRNNALSILCLYISVFWVICWISHYMFAPSLDYMILYMVIALCLNHNNRELDNQQMETTLKKILN